MKNSILKFKYDVIDGVSVSNFLSVDFADIRKYFKGLPTTSLDSIMVEDNDRFERISLDLYDSPDYWDILMIINDRHPLTGLPFSFDPLSALAEDSVLEYEQFVFGKKVPANESEIMYNVFESERLVDNEKNREIVIIVPSEIGKVMQDGFDKGLF